MLLCELMEMLILLDTLFWSQLRLRLGSGTVLTWGVGQGIVTALANWVVCTAGVVARVKFPRDLGHSCLRGEGVSLSGLVRGQVAPVWVLS